MVYFDHNATAPLLPEARQAWLDATDRFIGNPSSPHRIGGRADQALAGARAELAALLRCDALDIVWTSGATEAANMVLHHCAVTSKPSAEIWISAIEHPCVIAPAKHYFADRLRLIPVTPSGAVDLSWVEHQLKRSSPSMAVVMAANNETGVLQPWREMLALCHKKNVPFFSDATQWIGKLSADDFGQCDFISGSAHKFGGPKGVGFLKCPSKGRFQPLMLGGQQEEGRRAGTENVPGILAMIAALNVRQAAIASGEIKSRAEWQRRFEAALCRRLPGAIVVGKGEERLWNTVSALMPEADCRQRWVVKLDKLGIAVSTGSACASGREEPSHVLAAMGFSASEAGRMLRFSSGWETGEEDWDALLDALERVQEDLSRGQKRVRADQKG